MKKAYETPTVEKIEFNYRDQIVVASAGAAALSDNRRPDEYSWEEWADAIQQWNFEMTGVSICRYV